MKLSDIKPLVEAAGASTPLDQRPEFQQLRQAVGDQVAKDVLLAWEGDLRDYQRSGGKNFQSLVLQILSDNVLQRKYNIVPSREARAAISPVIQLVHHVMPDTSRMRAPVNSPYNRGVWGGVKFARESAEFKFQRPLYEALKRDVQTLLTS